VLLKGCLKKKRKKGFPSSSSFFLLLTTTLSYKNNQPMCESLKIREKGRRKMGGKEE